MVDDGGGKNRKLRIPGTTAVPEVDKSILAVLEPRALFSPEDRRLDWFEAWLRIAVP